MKDYWPLEKRPLPNHKERGFFQACKLSAKEHGYTGFMASARFLYRRYMDYFWQVLAFRVIPYSKMRVKLHKLPKPHHRRRRSHGGRVAGDALRRVRAKRFRRFDVRRQPSFLHVRRKSDRFRPQNLHRRPQEVFALPDRRALVPPVPQTRRGTRQGDGRGARASGGRHLRPRAAAL